MMKRMLKFSVILLFVGVVLVTAGFFMSDNVKFYIEFKDGKMVYNEYKETKKAQEYTVINQFARVELLTENDWEVKFVESNEYAIEYVVYNEELKLSCEDNVLKLKSGYKNRVYLINFDFRKPKKNKVIIYYPADEKIDVKISTDNGYISVSGLAGNIEGDVDLGELKIIDSNLGNVDFNIDCGEGIIKNCVVSGNILIDVDLGEVVIDKTELVDKDEYGYKIKNDLGNITINGSEIKGEKYTENAEADKMIDIDCDSGDVKINVH